MACPHDEVVSDTYGPSGEVLTLRCLDCGAVIRR